MARPSAVAGIPFGNNNDKQENQVVRTYTVSLLAACNNVKCCISISIERLSKYSCVQKLTPPKRHHSFVIRLPITSLDS